MMEGRRDLGRNRQPLNNLLIPIETSNTNSQDIIRDIVTLCVYLLFFGVNPYQEGLLQR